MGSLLNRVSKVLARRREYVNGVIRWRKGWKTIRTVNAGGVDNFCAFTE